MTRKSRKLQSSFCEVDYVFRLPAFCTEQWFWFSAERYHGTPVAVDQGIHFSETFCHWDVGQFQKLC